MNATRTRLSATEHALNFTLTGPVLMSLQLQPRPGVRLVRWNVLDTGVPPPNVFQQREAYFVLMTHGLDGGAHPVTLVLRTGDDSDVAPLVDVSLVTMHWEYHHEHTTTFAGLLAKMPDWTFTVPSVASVQSWTF